MTPCVPAAVAMAVDLVGGRATVVMTAMTVAIAAADADILVRWPGDFAGPLHFP